MKKVKDLQQVTMKTQEELTKVLISGTDSTGQAIATYNGMTVPVGIAIQKALLGNLLFKIVCVHVCTLILSSSYITPDKGVDVVSRAASEAMIAAHRKASEGMVSKMKSIYTELGIPIPGV